jgi:DNA-directed RNA polymerase subunit L
LAAARDALEANEARRHAIALAAETGDAEAKREAATLAKAAASLKDAIEHSLTPAVAQAAQRVTAARLDADHEAKREIAIKVRAISARLAARGAVLDAALNQMKDAYQAFHDDLTALATLGAPTPSVNLLEVNCRRALDAAISGLHSKTRPIPPLQRHSFDELLRGWAQMSERWAAAILDAPVKQKDAA